MSGVFNPYEASDLRKKVKELEKELDGWRRLEFGYDKKIGIQRYSLSVGVVSELHEDDGGVWVRYKDALVYAKKIADAASVHENAACMGEAAEVWAMEADSGISRNGIDKVLHKIGSRYP